MRNTAFLLSLMMLCFPDTRGQGKDAGGEEIEIYVTGHAHMDPVYRWRWNEIQNRELENTFSGVLDVMEEYPELHFVQSYLLYYETIQQHFPALYDRVRSSIEQGRWSVVGGQWVEPDENLSSGESLIRQFLIARDYYSKNLPIEAVEISWSPDNFTGHPVTLPKIYAGCGIKTHVFSRAEPEGKKVFRWESRDGSAMLAYRIPGHYNPSFRELPEYIREWTGISGYARPLITIGRGDHGGGPGPASLNALDRLSEEHSLKFVHTSPGAYFEAMHRAGKDWPVQREEFGYEHPGPGWKGCYTSQAGIKLNNRRLENQLLAAEKFTSLGTLYKGKPFYPREDLVAAWKILLFNQFHDIAPGTLTGLAADDAMKQYQKLDQISMELLINGLENIGNRIDTRMEGIPLVVYNPHSWPVSQFVEAEIDFVRPVSGLHIVDDQGKRIPFDIMERSENGLKFKLSIDAREVPPLGYQVFEVMQGEPEPEESDLKIRSNTIENAYYIVQWDDVGLTRLYHKEMGKEMLDGHGNALQLLEDHGNSWSLDLTGNEFSPRTLSPPEIVYRSALKATVRWEDDFQSSRFVRTMTVRSGCDQIDFEMEIDWHDHDKLLRVVFPAAMKDGEGWYDQPYGYVKREGKVLESVAQKWIDCSNEQYGLALLNNGKYGFSINEGVMTMSVIRGARDMDPRMDEGEHRFQYAVVAHAGDWRAADIPLKAWQFNQPLVARQENRHRGNISGWRFTDQSFPLKKSFFSIDSDHVIISSLKIRQDAYNPYEMVIRIVETEGRDENVTVTLPHEPRMVVECDHLERQIDARSPLSLEGDRFHFQIGHDQIRSFLVRF